MGFLAMFLGSSWFWMVWVLGFTVLVPLLSVLLGVKDDSEPELEQQGKIEAETSDGRDALETLRNRYPRGELTDEQFERKLERLLETETIEDVEDARRRVDGEESTSEKTPGADDGTERSADAE